MVAITIRPPSTSALHRTSSSLHRRLSSRLGSCSFKKAPRVHLKMFGKSISIAFDCKHSTVVNGQCLHCDQRMPDDYGVAFDYIFEGLRLSLDEIARLKVTNSDKVFCQKKLHLVLDLDHTLLHTKAFEKLTPEESYLKEQTDSDTSNGSLFVLNDHYLVKLRPFVRTFLKEASSMFQIYVCSMGSRSYVKKVAQFLDPEGKYFDTRLIAREDFGQKAKKNLNLVLGQDYGTVIVDDTQSVWSDHLNNLITVERYNYFTDHDRSSNRKSHAEMKTDESESDGELVNVLGVLTRVHGCFFDSPMDVKDVRYLPF
ncbi:hypothetical protein ACOSQ4_026261 [Xanthoceras sorbifolium]